MRRRIAFVVAITAAACAAAFAFRPASRTGPSVCFGTADNGRLENGIRLPASSANFKSYSILGITLGRTYVHDKVHATVVDAYALLQSATPDTIYVYGETGLAQGGRFKPHKTHQNGTSVDFMVPVLKDGKSVPLPSTPINKFGYALEFDARGKMGEHTIDFEALAQHLGALADAAPRHGIGIRRIILDVPLQKRLFRAPSGARLRDKVVFSQRKPWVRHDEHYHVDFDVPCERL